MTVYVIFNVILFIVFLKISFKSLRSGLLFSIILLLFFSNSLPFELLEREGLTILITYIILGIITLQILNKKRIIKKPFVIIGILILFNIFILANLNIYSLYGYEKVIYFFIKIVVPCILLSLYGPYSTKDLNVIIGAFSYGLVLVSVKMLFMGDFDLLRVTFSDIDPITIGRELGQGILGMSIFLLINKKSKLYLKIFCAICIVLGLILLFYTGSKGPIVSLIIASIFIYIAVLMAHKDRIKKLMYMLIIFSIFAICSPKLVQLIPGAERFFHSLVNLGENSSDLARKAIFKQAYELGNANIFNGVGTGGFDLYSIQYRYPHNIFLEIFSEQGMLGIVIFFILISIIIYHIISKLRFNIQVQEIFIIAVFIYLFINAQFSMDISSNSNLFIIGFILVVMSNKNSSDFKKIEKGRECN